MTRIARLVAGGIAVAALTATTYAALAGLGLTAPVETGVQVPFRGRLEGVHVVTPLVFPLVNIVVDASGNATQLGGFTLEVPHVVNVVAMSATGSYNFVAANGDELFADFTGQGTLVGPGLVSVVETATITGGTGRFENATGSFTAERLVNQAALTSSGSFDGTVSLSP